eukprot:CAMPEP_0118651916 /NCGR_PEP_ID=MMETSP0785-20121206/11038_1 /TAXON_ID=91992 /ORGANISM="Bolidomonas pacifica, Strain CCMP 1866" /LENGTH=104 /DNA_ID=CAMNT_0006544395 /DNA_START=360 /DNA_END=674 /DNA_ORIENTATION=-
MSYVLVKEDIQKRSAKETSNGRISLERAREPVLLSPALRAKTGVQTSADVPPLTASEKSRMKTMLMEKYKDTEWMKERRREMGMRDKEAVGAKEREILREKLTR